MSVEIYKPNEEIPYTAEQLSTLCKPESIDPQDFLDDNWRDSRYGIFYVKDGAPIGVAFCSISGGGEIERHVALHVLCVSQKERKGGYGSLLLKQVDELTHALGLKSIRISAIETQLSFYERNGFVVIAPEDDEDGYIAMKKTLAGGTRRKKTRRVRGRQRKTLRGRYRAGAGGDKRTQKE